MKQRIRVVSIARKGSGILLLKRSMGRMEGEPSWELPTGKIRLGEQPEEAMTRTIYEFLGVSVKDMKLVDATTFVALAGADRLSNLYIVYEVDLADEKLVLGGRYTAYKYIMYGGSADLRLDDATRAVLDIEMGRSVRMPYRMVANGATVYVDGGSRGNPGPSGVGYYIVGENGEELARGGEFIGFATSRVAEYYALKTGLEKAVALGLKSVRVVGDSLMVINQMNGIYRVKNLDLVPIYNDVQRLLKKFEAATFVHVKREQNAVADKEVNLAIDRHFELADEGDLGGGHIDT